jgi:DNA-binding transcriptional LysR family regulator
VGAPPELYGEEVYTIEFRLSPVVYFCRAGHPLTLKPGFACEELLLYPRIGIEAAPEWTRMYAEFHGFKPESDEALRFHFAESNDWDTLKRIVRMTDSISAGPREVVKEELDAGVLEELDFEFPDVELSAMVAYLRDRVLPPAAEALIDEIKRITSRAAADL